MTNTKKIEETRLIVCRGYGTTNAGYGTTNAGCGTTNADAGVGIGMLSGIPLLSAN